MFSTELMSSRLSFLAALGLALSLAAPGLAQQAAEAPDAEPPAPLERADPAAGGDSSSDDTDDAPSDPATAESPDPAEGASEPAANPASDDDDPLYNDADRYNATVDDGPSKGEGTKAKAGNKGAKDKQPKGGESTAEDGANEPAGSDAVRDTRPDEPYEPQGLGTGVTYPIQFCAGCLSVSVLTGLLAPLSAVPFIGWLLVPLVVWGVTSTVMTTVGDGVGKNRGQIAWPWLAGMCVDMACAGVSATLLGAIFGVISTVSGLGLTAIPQVVDPTMIPTDSQSLQAYLLATVAVLGVIGVIVGAIAFGLISATRCASVNAAAITYTVASDTKKDDDFRFPGFFSANHGEEDEGGERRVRSRDEGTGDGPSGDEGYEDEGDDEDEGYEDEGDDAYEGGSYAWFWGEVGVPTRNVGSISF